MSSIYNGHHRELHCESLWRCHTSLLKRFYVLALPHCSDILKELMASLGFLLFYFWEWLVNHLKGVQLPLPEPGSLPFRVWGMWDAKGSVEVGKKGPLLGWEFAVWWETAGVYLREPDSSKPVPMEMTDTCIQGRYLGPLDKYIAGE